MAPSDLVRRLLFPAVMTGTWIAARAGFGAGVHPTVVVGGIMLVDWAVLTACERLLPYDPDWNRSRGDVGTDVAHNIVSSAVFEVCKALLILGLGAIAPAGGLGLWPHTWPMLAQVALALLVNEVAQYPVHRYAHTHADSFLWRLHAVHHGPTRVYWFNAAREHPLLSAIFMVSGVAPLFVLGISEEALATFALCTAVNGYFQHVNIDVRYGPLAWVFSSPELHRWHHSTQPGPGTSNYGDNLVVCDWLFGTLYRPPTPVVGAVGIADLPRYPEGWLRQVLSPWRWARLQAEAGPTRSAGATGAGARSPSSVRADRRG